jgi:hypothetical protein
MLEARRNHTANIVGKYLIIFGGVNTNNVYLKNVTAINLETFKV